LGLHVLGLALCAWVLTKLPPVVPRDTGASALVIPGSGLLAEEPWIALDTPAALGVNPDEIAQVPTAHPDFPEADMANEDDNPASGAQGIPGQVAAPSADSGEGTGRQLPLAWRRDSSTLRAHLSTGAREYQPSRVKNARTSASREASRRERRTGMGDSVRTELPRPTEVATGETTPAASPSEDDDPAPTPSEERRTPPLPGEDTLRGEGPLNTDVGSRAFDVPTEGAARDNIAARAASNEMQPGISDYAAVAARGPGTASHGPGAEPGITSAPSAGAAPAFAGWPRPRPASDEAGAGTNEREFSRENLEIGRRVKRVLRFPSRLALNLEQGEAIVQFLVERDGRVRGQARLVKSAGFEEFDREALDVVRRAAPYPRLAQARTVTLRIPFENPLVR
jgi:protein TonB